MVPFPIPSTFGRPISELRFGASPLNELIGELTDGQIDAHRLVHLDPDLASETVPRKAGWTGAFGQVGAAQGHLRNQGVGPGDLFLFFGWYSHIEGKSGNWRYVGPQIHSLFGWLQVAEVLPVGDGAAVRENYPWLADHPHLEYANSIGVNNTVYVATSRLMLGGREMPAPGAGIFRQWDSRLQLTAANQSRSVWQLPGWMLPADGKSKLSYHKDSGRWMRIAGGSVRLQTVGKGQELVLNTPDLIAAEDWLSRLFEHEANA